MQQLQHRVKELTDEKVNEQNKIHTLENQLNSAKSQLQQANEKILQIQERVKYEERATMSESLQQEFSQIQSAKDKADEKLQGKA